MTLAAIFTWLVRLLAGLVVLGAAAAAVLWVVVSGSLPDYDRDFEVSGPAAPSAPVEILRDANGIPHISGATERDVFFGLGFVHAQDRLWQMEIARRAAQGRLAELFGPPALENDKRMRRLGLARVAARAMRAQTPETRAMFEAYAEGVNARIRAVQAEALGRGAPEFFLFPARISPWTPTDSFSVMKLMSLQVSDQAAAEVRRALFAVSLPAARLRDILPDEPLPAIIEAGAWDAAALEAPWRAAGAAAVPPSPAAAAGAGDVAADGDAAADAPALPWLSALLPGAPGPVPAPGPLAAAFFPEPGHAGASNAWALAPGRAAAGASILAADPHLPFTTPSSWHLARLDLPRPDGPLGVIGAAIPGMPFFLHGRNGDFAWGMTTAYVDDADIFIERLAEGDPTRYLAPDGPLPFTTRQEVIAVAGAPSETVEIRATRHGPVLDPADWGVGQVTPAGHVAALSWTALAEDDMTASALYVQMTARSIADGQKAAAMAGAPAQNLVHATAEEIAFTVAGRIPLRRPGAPGAGRLPSPGWTGAGDWIGWAPREAHPTVVNPASGAVANTNNRTQPEDPLVPYAARWGDSYRILRLDRQLSAREFHTRDSAQALQSDAVSEMARAVLPLIARDLWWSGDRAPEDEVSARRRRALEMLGDWNGEMSAHAPEPLIFAEWMRRLTFRLAEDELGPLITQIEGPRPVFVERVFRNIDGAAIWCDVDKTPREETCAEMARAALDDALADLAARYGAAPEGWRWGEAHRAVHPHPVLTRNPVAAFIADIEHDMSGGDYTLLRAQSKGKGDTPHRAVHGAGFRMVVDFADPDSSMFVIATGQSGHPFSRRYDDLSELWRRGDMVRMSLDRAHAEAASAGRTRLIPAE
ncbi:penicillin acylase family protein [Rhodovulum sp. DZ06]|uniref:penicillin acylase family protein n=1 Tax=Rhodovulum sp. DZ06 TaxID=3425126 RepID=UPI003D3348D3